MTSRNKKQARTTKQSNFYHLEKIPGFVSNPTLHNDLKIPFVQQEITLHANKYKLHAIGHSNRPISELFHQSKVVRRFQSIWSEEPAKWFRRTIDGWYLTQDIHLTYCLLITLQKPE
jgi:hypothetical protein